MIRQTLTATKAATFLVRLREPGQTEGMFMPAGTGFFVSPDGYFITAHHVVERVGRGEPVVLSRPPDYYMGDDNAPPLTPENQRHFVLLVVSDVQIVQVWPAYDLALLKADFEKTSKRVIGRAIHTFPTSSPSWAIKRKALLYMPLAILWSMSVSNHFSS